MRKRIRLIHLFIGILTGPLVAIIGISGSLYVFEPEIKALIDSSLYAKSGSEDIFQNDYEIVNYIEKETGEKLHSLQWPQRKRETYQFKLMGNKQWFYLDPSTGIITPELESLSGTFFRFILKLHTKLLLGDLGHYITSISSLLFAIFLLSTGIYLWWPIKKGRMKSSFSFKKNASPKRFNYDLHNLSGFYFSIPLFFMAITGAYFTYSYEIQWFVDKITFSEPAPLSQWGKIKSDTSAKTPPLTASQAIAEVEKFREGLFSRNIWIPDKADETISFSVQRVNQVSSGPDTRIFFFLDQYTGKLLYVHDPNQYPHGSRWVATWYMPVHFGEFGGMPTRIIWFIGGFLPAILFITGIKIWIGRKNKKTKRKKNIAIS